MDKKKLVGRRLGELRKRRGLSQEELAEIADTSASYLSRMERGTENPTLDMLGKISDALGVEMWELFDYGHQTGAKEIKEAINRLVKDADEKDLRLAIKVFRSVIR
ncbi:MAG: helix-turn-helix transcriptional regulator [Nitrospinae bacterium]|nr:helix-turn-helix transcriptional regulator [Nitrospinota bacterium]